MNADNIQLMGLLQVDQGLAVTVENC